MAKTRLPYAPEFRRQMVELVNAGRSPEELAREFEPTASGHVWSCRGSTRTPSIRRQPLAPAPLPSASLELPPLRSAGALRPA